MPALLDLRTFRPEMTLHVTLEVTWSYLVPIPSPSTLPDVETEAQREAGSCPRSQGGSEPSPEHRAGPYSCDTVWVCSAWAVPEEAPALCLGR